MGVRAGWSRLGKALLCVVVLASGIGFVRTQPSSAAPVSKNEVVGKRTPTSKTFQLSDGTYETEFYRAPIFYATDSTTTLQPIDSSLAETGTPDGQEYQSKANRFTSRLPLNLNTQWVTVESTTAAVAYRPISRPFVPENALAARSNGERKGFGNSRIDYPGAFESATLEYESQPTGLKETIVLDHWSGKNVFSFDLRVTGAWPYLNQYGGIDFISAESTVPVFQMPAPYMEDSADLGQGESNFSRAVRYELEPTERGWRLDVIADRDWLQDPNRVYPVRIDPTVRYAWIDPLYADQTVFVSEANPSTNYNNFYEGGTFPLKVGKPGATRYRSFLRNSYLATFFDGYWPEGDTDVQISYARLELNCFYASPNPMSVNYSEVTTPWDPDTVTWNNRPSTSLIGDFSAHENEAWNIYITDLAQKWLANPSTNHGIMLWSDVPGQFSKFNAWDQNIDKCPYFRFAWTTVPKVKITSPAPDTPVGGEPTIIWDYDDDTHGLGDGQDLISKPQSSIQIQVADTPASTPLFTITRSNWSDYDKTIMPSDFNQWVTGKRYFVRMRASGATSTNAGHDPEIWSNWTAWTSFIYRPVAEASDDEGIEAHRASEPIGTGASVELSSGALVISREDLAGPARGGSLSFGMTYRSDQAGTAEAPAAGWRPPLPALVTDDEQAPDPGFSGGSPAQGGWTVSSGAATVSYVVGGRRVWCLSISATSNTTAYVATSSNSKADLLEIYPGERLDASAYLKGQNLVVDGDSASGSDLGGVVKVRFYDAEGAYLSQVGSGNYTEQNATSWRRVGVKAIAPANAYYARMTVDYVNASGTLLVDDAHFGNRRLAFTDADGTGHTYEQTAEGRYTVDPLNNSVAPELAELAKGAKVTASSPAVNKVPEPGFETLPTPDWYRSDTSVITRSTAIKRTGSYSMRFYSSAYTSEWLSSAVPTSAMMAVFPGQKAYASAWVNSEGLLGDSAQTERGLLLKIHYYTTAGSLISGSSTSSGNFTTSDTNGWKQLAVTGTAPANAAFAKCNVEFRNARNIVYVDDVEFSTGCPGTGKSVDSDDAITTTGYDSVPAEATGSTWLQYDLGKRQVFSNVALTLWDQPLDPASDVATYTYSIRVSDDPLFTTSTEIVGSTSQRGFVEHRLAAPTKGRYVRIIPTSESSNSFFRIAEFSLPQLRIGRMPVMTDASGRVTGFADESSNLISRGYDSSGRLGALADESGRRIALAYKDGKLSSLDWHGIDSSGVDQTMSARVAYASSGDTLTVTADEGGGAAAVCSYHYASGRIDRIVDADGVAMGIDYDPAGRVEAVHYADGTTKSFSAGTNQAVVAVGSLQATITATVLWDPATQRVTKTTAGAGTSLETSTTYKYDGYGNARYVIDGEGHQTTTIADGHGNVVRVDESAVRESTARYEDDLVVESKDAKGNTSTFEYDDARRLLSASAALSEEAADEEGAETATYASYDEYGNKLTANLAGSTAANLVLNGGFERDPVSAGNGWIDVRSGASLATQTVDANTGAAYVRLHSASAESYMFSDYVEVDAEKTYALSAWTRGTGHIEIREYNASGTEIDTRAPIRFSGSTSEPFERAVSTYWPTQGTEKVRVRLWAAAGDTANVDNVRLEMSARAGSDSFCDNGSFEIVSGSDAKGWSKRGSTTAIQEVLSDAVGVSGVHTIRVDVETAGDGGNGYFVSEPIPVIAGTRYSAAGYMKTGKLTNDALMRVVWRNATSQVVATSVFATATGTTAWKRYVGNVIAPAGATKAEMSCFVYGGAGAARFDAVTFEAVRNAEIYHYDQATNTYLVRTDTTQGRSIGSDIDSRGRSLRSYYATSTGGAAVTVSSSEYDGRGRLATVTAFPASGLGISAHYDYTAAGRLTRVVDPLKRTYELSYTPSGKLHTVTDPLGFVSKTLYDGLGRVSQQLRPTRGAEPTAPVTESRYDALSRLSSTTFFDPGGTAVETASVTYDRNGNVTRSALASATWSVESDYDTLDRLTVLNGTGPAGDYGLSTTYDLADLPDSVAYRAFNATKTVDNTYLKTNEWKSTRLIGGSSTWFFSFGVGGELRRYGSSIGFALRDYDAAGRFKSLRLGSGPDGGDRYAYQRVSYDDWERIANVATDYADKPDALDSFEYDAAGRLTSWSRSGSDTSSATYAFDAAGNLTERTDEGVTTELAYNAANQLTSETVGSVETTHGYDELGRLVSSSSPSATTSYTWDARGHLTRIAAGDTTATYAYGVEGMRQSKSVETSSGVATTKSVWAGQRLVAEEYSDGSRADFLYGPEGLPLELVYTTDAGAKTTYAYQVDAGGSVIGLTTAAGTEVASFAYDPWGAPIAASVDASHPAAARNPLRYRGYYWDAESGLYYLPARYYDPKTARLLSADPAPPAAGSPVSLNRYAYCEGDPVSAADPTGEAPDYDGNGKIDSWDSQAHAAWLATNKQMKAYFSNKAAASWYSNQASKAKNLRVAELATEKAKRSLTAARGALHSATLMVQQGGQGTGWLQVDWRLQLTKPDGYDWALMSTSATLEGVTLALVAATPETVGGSALPAALALGASRLVALASWARTAALWTRGERSTGDLVVAYFGVYVPGASTGSMVVNTTGTALEQMGYTFYAR